MILRRIQFRKRSVRMSPYCRRMGEELREISRTTVERVRLHDVKLRWIDLSDAAISHAGLAGVRMRGVELMDVEIDGELQNVVINGVDVAPLIEAELTRRDPDYAKMKPRTADEFREAWEVLERLWGETVCRARGLDPTLLHERVDGEWSFIETLRHLVYATDSWVNRVYLGDPDPFDPWDLPFETLRDLEWPHPTDIRPGLDDVLALRADRQATVRRVFAGLTDRDLAGRTKPVEGPGWPPPDTYDVAEVLWIVVNEEWHHRRYAERDLGALTARVR
jgi:uncharacterized damage-inducible protein DinB